MVFTSMGKIIIGSLSLIFILGKFLKECVRVVKNTNSKKIIMNMVDLSLYFISFVFVINMLWEGM